MCHDSAEAIECPRDAALDLTLLICRAVIAESSQSSPIVMPIRMFFLLTILKSNSVDDQFQF